MRDNTDNSARTHFRTRDRRLPRRQPGAAFEAETGHPVPPVGSLPLNERVYWRVTDPADLFRPLPRVAVHAAARRDEEEPGYVIHLPVRVGDIDVGDRGWPSRWPARWPSCPSWTPARPRCRPSTTRTTGPGLLRSAAARPDPLPPAVRARRARAAIAGAGRREHAVPRPPRAPAREAALFADGGQASRGPSSRLAHAEVGVRDRAAAGPRDQADPRQLGRGRLGTRRRRARARTPSSWSPT